MPTLCLRWFLVSSLLVLLSVPPCFGATDSGETQAGRAADGGASFADARSGDSPATPLAGEPGPALKSIPAQNNILQAFLSSMEMGSLDFLSRMESLRKEVLSEIANSQEIERRLCNDRGRGHFLKFMSVLMGITLVSIGVLLILRRFFEKALLRRMCARPAQESGAVKAFILRILGSVFSLGAYFLVFFMLLLVSIPGPGPERIMGRVFFIVLTYVLILQIFAKVLLSPDWPGVRPMPLGDAAAATLYRWLVAIVWLTAVLAVSSMILGHVGEAPALGKVLHASAGIAVSLLLCAMILVNRRRVAEALSATGSPQSFQALLAPHWHYPALAYALFMGTFWSVRALTVQEPLVRLVLAMFLIPVCIGLDLWVRRLFETAVRDEVEAFSLNGDADDADAPLGAGAFRPMPKKQGLREYYPVIHKVLRAALLVLPVFIIFRMWGVEIPVGWLFARDVLGILLVGVACLLTWEIISIRIDRQLREELDLSGVNPEDMDEGGGAGGSRRATLLVLLRKFLMAVLVVMGTLMGLSALGVDIAPLIAGAGVIGLAIGFGAQTLVKDILSGIFFLVDDAFRVGDYVETGSAKGTVEHISLRSMRLRHPRGMIYTVPFGGLKIIQNYSRDYIISKLDFRIRYDADIEKIRKVIKRVNKDVQADENLRSGLLSNIKSNGVRGMEDSAMILRVKFKTVPGYQFVMSKEVYRRIQEAFRKNGIEFAHRNVTVYLPPEVQSLLAMGDGEKSIAGSAIGAAAAAAVLLDEEEKARIAAEAAAKAKVPEEE